MYACYTVLQADICLKQHFQIKPLIWLLRQPTEQRPVTRTMTIGLCALSTLLIGINAGFFYTWSFTIMQSLGLTDTDSAITAMQTINANIRNGWFAIVFFGAPAALLVAGVQLLGVNHKAAIFYLLSVVLAAVTVAITFTLHVPMNNALAAVDAPTAATTVWSDYAGRWTRWNHFRTGTSLLAFIASLSGFGWLLSHADATQQHTET